MEQILILLLLSLMRANAQQVTKPDRHFPVTDSDEKAIALAIEDEIYDEGCQGAGADAALKFDDQLNYEQRIFVQPYLRSAPEVAKDGKGPGWILYKLMPIGEVYRMYWIRADGLAVLDGHPEWNFPPTEPSYLTVYLDDDDLIQFKRTWIQTNFVISLRPTRVQVQQAAARQKKRMEGEYRLHKRDCGFRWRSR